MYRNEVRTDSSPTVDTILNGLMSMFSNSKSMTKGPANLAPPASSSPILATSWALPPAGSTPTLQSTLPPSSAHLSPHSQCTEVTPFGTGN